MDLYLKVRRVHFQDGLSGRRIARDFGISRDSVSKMLAYSEPPGYRRTAPVKRPRLDGFTDQIDQWLLEDKVRPRKQRHTAKRVFERLRDESTGGTRSGLSKTTFAEKARLARDVRAVSHPAGHAQADFGEALVPFSGIEQKAPSPMMPHSVTPVTSGPTRRRTPRLAGSDMFMRLLLPMRAPSVILYDS